MSKKNQNHYFSAHPSSELNLGIIHTCLRNTPFKFLTASGVFSKKRVDLGTRVLIESMILPPEGNTLDVGCGYGAIGISAATFQPDVRVFMVDVNHRAVWLTKQNIKKNNVKNATGRQGHLYEPVKDLSFNCILSNPPVSAGMRIVRAVITESKKYMTKKATFQMVVRSKIGKKRIPKLLKRTFGNFEILEKKSGYRVFISEKQ